MYEYIMNSIWAESLKEVKLTSIQQYFFYLRKCNTSTRKKNYYFIDNEFPTRLRKV